MNDTNRSQFDSFDQFYEALNSDYDLAQRIGNYPDLEAQMKQSLQKLYEQIKEGGELAEVFESKPREAVVEFFRAEMDNYELSELELESVAGGKPDLESNLGYDLGYAVGSIAEFVYDVFN